ncbi:alpha/beta hydrolase [Halpernia sp.]|uniref:alpha/beta hydrolase n=1 Tax=Halpernia sp. TaxID=2782209 RepID=UPI003A8E7981
MKVYVISGLGADFKVLEKLKFNSNLEIVFIDWLIPKSNETFKNYVSRMAETISIEEDFYLLGYSFGGILVQEIHKIKPAKKILILGCIKSDEEKSFVMKAGKMTKITAILPLKFYGAIPAESYGFIRRIFDSKNSNIMTYFRVRDPYYLKWSIQKIIEWKMEKIPEVIQILGEKDLVFPLKNSHPNYVIKDGTHLFPLTKNKEVSEILAKEFI